MAFSTSEVLVEPDHLAHESRTCVDLDVLCPAPEGEIVAPSSPRTRWAPGEVVGTLTAVGRLRSVAGFLATHLDCSDENADPEAQHDQVKNHLGHS